MAWRTDLCAPRMLAQAYERLADLAEVPTLAAAPADSVGNDISSSDTGEAEQTEGAPDDVWTYANGEALIKSKSRRRNLSSDGNDEALAVKVDVDEHPAVEAAIATRSSSKADAKMGWTGDAQMPYH